MTRPLYEPTERALAEKSRFDIEQLQRRPVPFNKWIYVGSFPGDPFTTVDSPPFQNAWTNDTSDPDNTPLRFKLQLDGGIQIEGMVLGITSGTIVFTLPSNYKRDKTLWLPGASTNGAFTHWKIEPNGDVTAYIGSASGGHGVRVTTVNGQSIPDDTTVQLDWEIGAGDYDTDGYFDGGTPDVLTIPPDLDGLYEVISWGRLLGSSFPSTDGTLIADDVKSTGAIGYTISSIRNRCCSGSGLADEYVSFVDHWQLDVGDTVYRLSYVDTPGGETIDIANGALALRKLD